MMRKYHIAQLRNRNLYIPCYLLGCPTATMIGRSLRRSINGLVLLVSVVASYESKLA